MTMPSIPNGSVARRAAMSSTPACTSSTVVTVRGATAVSAAVCTPRPATYSRTSLCGSSASVSVSSPDPGSASAPYAKKVISTRYARSLARRVPAAPLRGLAKGAAPCSVRTVLARSNCSWVIRISPRTSRVAGAPRRSGSPSTVPIACETSSPAVPSPRVISRSRRPCS